MIEFKQRNCDGSANEPTYVTEGRSQAKPTCVTKGDLASRVVTARGRSRERRRPRPRAGHAAGATGPRADRHERVVPTVRALVKMTSHPSSHPYWRSRIGLGRAEGLHFGADRSVSSGRRRFRLRAAAAAGVALVGFGLSLPSRQAAAQPPPFGSLPSPAMTPAPPVASEAPSAREGPLLPPNALVPYPPPGYAANRDLGPNPFPINEDDFGSEGGRHAGLWLRLMSGPIHARLGTAGDGGATNLNGWGAAVSVAVGAAIIDDFVLYGELSGASALNPSVQAPSSEGPGHLGIALTTLGVGGGLAYYFMPVDLYVSGAVMLAQARAVERSSERLLGRTAWGPATAFSVGKEWWLSDHFGLGVALRADLASLADAGGSGVTWHSVGLSAALSLSFQGG